MIRYLRNPQIDKAKWDACIATASNGIIYAYSWYLDVVCPGWDALVEHDYEAVMPLTRGRKYLMDYLFPPPFVQQLGIFAPEPVDQDLTNRMFRHIPDAYRFTEMNLHISNVWTPEGFAAKSMRDQILGMSRSLDSIRAGYSTNHQRNIRKAKMSALAYTVPSGPAEIIQMFRSNKGRFIDGIKPGHYDMLVQLVAEAGKRDMVQLRQVLTRDRVPCAGAIFFESHRTSIFIFSATTAEGKSLSAMHLLIDSYIAERHGTIERLDFEGSNDRSLSRFYSGFGSTDYVYLQIKNNRLPFPWRLFKN